MGCSRLECRKRMDGMSALIPSLPSFCPSKFPHSPPKTKLRFISTHIAQTLLLPTMFKNISEKTFYVFGACNFISIPIVWALYPESNQRTLEEMDLLFAADSIWNWDAEKTFARLKEENPDLVQAAQRHQSVVSGLEGGAVRKGSRGMSLVPGGEKIVVESEEGNGNTGKVG